MTDKKLLDRLANLGFPLFVPTAVLEVNETLAEVVKSADPRLWEGFPALLAKAADTYQLAPEEVERRLPTQGQKDRFHRLLVLAAALYSSYHLSFSWMEKVRRGFSREDRLLGRKWQDCLAQNQPIPWDDVAFSPERLKGLFDLYFEQRAAKEHRQKERSEEFSLEFALSQLFSPKQKELFKKKLEGLPLTKTEQEYYSRAVKKKVVALANSDLHSLARKLLER